MSDSIRAFVAESRRAQGLSPKIKDPATVSRLARLIVTANEEGPATSGPHLTDTVPTSTPPQGEICDQSTSVL